MAEYHWSNDLAIFLTAGPDLAENGGFPPAAGCRFFVRIAGIAGLLAIGALAAVATARPASAATPANCAGDVMMGGAELMCSLPVKSPPQLCTYSWALTTADNEPKVVNGSFLLPPGVANMQIYEAFGFNNEMSPPIVLCNEKPDSD